MSRSAPGIEPSPIIPKHRNGTEHPKEGRSPTVSYALWTVQDLNLRPTGCKPDTLPTELTVQKSQPVWTGPRGPLSRPVESDTPTGASGLARALPPYPAGSTHSHRVGLNRRYRAHCVTAGIEPAHMRMSAQATTPVAPLRRWSSPFIPRPPRTRRLVVISH